MLQPAEPGPQGTRLPGGQPGPHVKCWGPRDWLWVDRGPWESLRSPAQGPHPACAHMCPHPAQKPPTSSTAQTPVCTQNPPRTHSPHTDTPTARTSHIRTDTSTHPTQTHPLHTPIIYPQTPPHTPHRHTPNTHAVQEEYGRVQDPTAHLPRGRSTGLRSRGSPPPCLGQS